MARPPDNRIGRFLRPDQTEWLATGNPQQLCLNLDRAARELAVFCCRRSCTRRHRSRVLPAISRPLRCAAAICACVFGLAGGLLFLFLLLIEVKGSALM